MIEVFCDGSPSPAVLIDPVTSRLGDSFVTRGMVVIEALDLGLVAQDRGEFGVRKGRALHAEDYSIHLANDLCARRRLEEYVIYNDNKGAVHGWGSARVQWRPREETHLPNRFFEQVLNRAAYLRSSGARGARRRPIQPHQQEIFELFNAERREFQLSSSPLWRRVKTNAEKWPRDYALRRRRPLE